MGLGRLIPACVLAAALTAQAQDLGASLRFRGNGSNDIDRVKIRAENKPVNVGSNFTIEFWMKATLAENPSGPISPGGDNWINGNIIVDRDIFGSPDYGDFGISMANGRIAFGANDGSTGYTIYGSSNVADGAWHHVAAVRQTSGVLRVFVDGRLDASSASGPTGNLQYRNGRSLSEPQWTNEPFIVIAAEKHDYDPSSYPSFSGWIDELRISSAALYTNHFPPPTEPFHAGPACVGLYHFDEGSGDTIADASGGGSDGIRKYGGTPAGPAWTNATPFDTDTDGVLDHWEQTWFTNLTTAGAGTDFDGDGFTDRGEWLAGTGPRSTVSAFVAAGVRSGASNVVIEWPALSNRVYNVSRSTNLVESFSNVASGLTAAPPTNAFTNAVSGAGPFFYRVGAARP